MWFLAAASAINIVLDLLTVCVLGMGVAGAAIATVVSQLGSGLLCVAYLKKRFPILHMEKDDWKTSRPEAMRLLGMGVPVGLQFSITAIGSVILQSAVNSLGAVCVSGVAEAPDTAFQTLYAAGLSVRRTGHGGHKLHRAESRRGQV